MSANKLCALLKCRYPLIQAPMLGSCDDGLAIAVARAGAVGSVPCTTLTVEELDAMLARHKREVPELPLMYNFFCHEMPSVPPAVSQEWLGKLAPFHVREGLGLEETAAGVAASLATAASVPSFSQGQLDVLLRHQPLTVSFHFGLPPASLWRQLRERGNGITTVGCATTVAEARVLAKGEMGGVDVLVAQGVEAGGHRGIFLARPPLSGVAEQVGLFSLLPTIRQVLDEAEQEEKGCGGSDGGRRRSPVLVAAGGVADARGVECALRLGADGVQVGTAFLLCDEATTHAAHRAALVAAKATLAPTQLTNVLSGRPARGLSNAVMQELGGLRDDVPPFPFAQNYLAALKKHDFAAYGSLWCGQNPSGLRAVPAATQVEMLMHDVRF